MVKRGEIEERKGQDNNSQPRRSPAADTVAKVQKGLDDSYLRRGQEIDPHGALSVLLFDSESCFDRAQWQ